MKNCIIGTHDSATGEKPANLLSWLITPFAKTQDLTIKQQFANGVRFFDIRVKKTGPNWWSCGHGLWTSAKSAYLILSELNELASMSTDKTYVSLCYEGKIKSGYERAEFIDFAYQMIKTFNKICFEAVAIKLPKWENIKVEGLQHPPYPLIHLFKTLDYSSWHTYFPCPRLWNMFYREKPQEFKINLYDFFK